jgi:hypothetical protein
MKLLLGIIFIIVAFLVGGHSTSGPLGFDFQWGAIAMGLALFIILLVAGITEIVEIFRDRYRSN